MTNVLLGESAHAITVGEKGRVVLPAPLRARHGWDVGARLVAVDTDLGAVLVSAEDALRWLRARWDGRDLVAELLAERRREVRDGAE